MRPTACVVAALCFAGVVAAPARPARDTCATTPQESAEVVLRSAACELGIEARSLRAGNRFNWLIAQPVMFQPESRSYKFTLLYFHQYAGDLPVYGAALRVLVRNAAGYPVVWVGSRLHALGAFDRDVVVDKPAAPAAAARAVPGLVRFGGSERVVLGGDVRCSRAAGGCPRV